MKLRVALLCLGMASGGATLAGGIDRSGQRLGPLFEFGDAFEMATSVVSPSVKGVDLLGGPTGDVAGQYRMSSLGVKFDLNDALSLGLVIDQPYGADLLYGESSSLLGGTRVDVSSSAALGLLRYRVGAGIGVHGGLRIQRASAFVRLQGLAYGPVSGYAVRLAEDTEPGGVLGVSYERPDIALRVSATYHGAIEHALATTETAPLPLLQGRSVTRIKTPRAVNLDFQTGIAPDTLLFGQIRWADWSQFRVDPERFMAVTGEGLIELKDTQTHTLGVAHRFNDRWTGALSLNREGKGDPLVSPLSPVNGRRGLTLAAIYTRDALRLTAGVSYIQLGDAVLETGTPDTPRAHMRGNATRGIGVSLDWAI